MPKEPLELPHFNFRPDPIEGKREIKQGGFGRQDVSYSMEYAERFLDDFKQFVKVYEEKLPTFWLIKTRKEYPVYSFESMKVINEFFSAELVKIVTDVEGIIKIPTDKLHTISKKIEMSKKRKDSEGEIPKYVAMVMDGKLEEWKTENKISKLLLTHADEVNSSPQKINAYLSTFSLFDKNEEKILKNDLDKFLHERNITLHENDLLNTLTLFNISHDELIEISKKSFIDYIDPILPISFSESSRQEPSSTDPQIIQTSSESLGSICTIDTGVTSEKMKDYVLKETLLKIRDDTASGSGHGTLVASIAMFGQKPVGKMGILKPLAKIISYNICEGEKPALPLHDALTEIVKKEIANTRVYNMSINLDYPAKNKDVLKAQLNQAVLIEKLINKTGIILVNSAGNIKNEKLLRQIEKDPNIVNATSVGSPAYAPSVFSVGAVNSIGNISNITLLGVPFDQKGAEKFINYRAPQIFAPGGSTQLGDDAIACISKNDSVTREIGTSFSAPQIALACQKVLDNYGRSFCKYSETVKAIVLSGAKRKLHSTKHYFYLDDIASVGTSSQSLNFNYEGEIRIPCKDKNIDGERTFTHKKNFYVPQRVEKIEFFLVSTPNYSFRNLDIDYIQPKLIFYGITKDKRNRRDIFESNIDNLNGPVAFGQVDFEKSYWGKWTWELSFEQKKIPIQFREQVNVKYGLSVKVTLADKTEEYLQTAYNEASKELGVHAIKDLEMDRIQNKLASSIQRFK